MKTNSKTLVTLLTLVAALAAPLALSAQSSSPEKVGPGSARRERGGDEGEGRRGPRGGGDRLKMLAERLKLNDEQKTKIGAILKDEMAAMEKLRDDSSVAREARRDKMREIRESHALQIRAVLTGEQAAKLDEMEKSMRERGPGGGRRGKDDDRK